MKYKKEFTINVINILFLILGLGVFITKFNLELLLFVFFLAYGNAVYMLCRHGYFKRLAEHTLEKVLLKNHPALVILVPSYKEEIPVIRQSILSSALQDYPNRRVVLLIDNPPDCPALKETRDLVLEINAELRAQHLKYKGTDAFEEVANWFETQGNTYFIRDHTDKKFVELTFFKRAADIRKRNEDFDIDSIFNVEISFFERKQYPEFSHVSNKSMNLNSYLSVLGKTVLDAEYVSVLDADSVLTYDYASRLIYEMEKEEFKKVAVIQTPYSAFPEAPLAIERLAGATTDMTFLFHQGFTYFGATFWVGANALIRKRALEDIVEHRMEDGKRVSIYVQDRTVIEDTESSVDLAEKGWQLHNFPERLSYSATPADFGSLLIQRKRWANGGLIILPKALRYLFNHPSKWKECFFRIHYLLSIPAGIFGFALMQFSSVPIADYALQMSLLTVPCLICYAHDLKHFGYRYTDVIGVIGLNTVLMPVNAAGVLQSFKQIFFGKRTPFFRTPKISDSTPVPIVYPVFFAIMLIAFAYHRDLLLVAFLLYGLAISFLKIPAKFRRKRVQSRPIQTQKKDIYVS